MALFSKPNADSVRRKIADVDTRLERERKKLSRRGPLGLNADGREYVTKLISSMEAERKGLVIELEKLTHGSANVR